MMFAAIFRSSADVGSSWRSSSKSLAFVLTNPSLNKNAVTVNCPAMNVLFQPGNEDS